MAEQIQDEPAQVDHQRAEICELLECGLIGRVVVSVAAAILLGLVAVSSGWWLG